MTRKQIVLNMMVNNKSGITIHNAMMCGGGNWPHKAIASLIRSGIKIAKIWEVSEDGDRYMRYRLMDVTQPEIKAALG